VVFVVHKKKKQKNKKKRRIWEDLLKKRFGRFRKRRLNDNPYPQSKKCSA